MTKMFKKIERKMKKIDEEVENFTRVLKSQKKSNGSCRNAKCNN